MYNLKNNPILLPHQIEILKLFFGSNFGKQFFLTGGTGLSAFYLAHRDSKDFDFFSIDQFDNQQIRVVIDEIAQKMDCEILSKVTSDTYHEIYLENKQDEWIQRIDIVKEQPKRFGKIVEVDGIRVDSLENIGSNKITAIFGRLEIKDYIDLYSILTNTNLTFGELFAQARQKDMGLSEFYFANIVAGSNIRGIQVWPKLHIDLDKEKMFDFYERLTEDLFLKIKPEDK
mgnify:CR=1 FL=1